MPTISRLMQQMARIRLGWVVFFTAAETPPLTSAGVRIVSIFDKVSPIKRCALRREDEKSLLKMPGEDYFTIDSSCEP
ncbi:hypothetical protein GCM10011586_07320 [Silvibacterium dinghuense]|nr:hypothetical protein GCM10011586_07320 [Silvibacterium dinghuense]